MSLASRLALPLLVLAVAAQAGCEKKAAQSSAPPAVKVAVASPCSGVWPSYWQDPAFNAQGMWAGQTVSDTPDSQNWTPANPAYTNPVFQLADAYSAGKEDDPAAQPWRDHKFDAMFDPATPQAQKAQLAHDYAWAVMAYMQDGNVSSGKVDTDWNLCGNTRRQWFNMAFQTYHPLTGREFVHGLTREAPVTLSVSTQAANLGTTVWAVAFYNGNAAPVLVFAVQLGRLARIGSWAAVAVENKSLPITVPSGKARLAVGSVAIPLEPQTLARVGAALPL